MNRVKKVGKFYMYTTIGVTSITLGVNLNNTKRMNFKEKCWKIADDVSLALLWPITAPKVIKNFANNFDTPRM